MRKRIFTMRLSAEEARRLSAVAKFYGLSAADALRMLVKRDYDQRKK